jgi:leucyl aminopeptidase
VTAPQFRVVAVPSTAHDLQGYTTVVLGVRPGRLPAAENAENAEAAEDAGSAEVLAGGAAAARLLGVDLAGHLRRVRAKGAAGEVTTIPLVAQAASTVETLLVVGVGDGGAPSLGQAGAAVARALGRASTVLGWLPLLPTGVGRFVEGFTLASYQVQKKPAAAEKATPVQVDLAASRPDRLAEPVRRAGVVGAAVHLARDLTNAPANLKSPQWLADQAVTAGDRAGLTVRVRDEDELAAEGFGGLIGVGQGSVRPPRLVELAYHPPGRAAGGAHVVLVGKGIVFDSGGISIKAAAGMESMKTDMAGAAAVLATMTALGALGVDLRVTGLLALAENMPGDAALRPSDVITPYGGRRTVEITNTDAEGRLVLADALGYADLALRADVVIDIATLTGAALLALGRLDAPLFATDDRLAAALLRASAESGERLWRMPLVEDYRPALASGTADLVNGVTDRSVGGGSITAALFLREFTGGRPWAHLDIAGTGRAEGSTGELSRGGTGFGVRLLLSFLGGWNR